jgi:hypothetical protein
MKALLELIVIYNDSIGVVAALAGVTIHIFIEKRPYKDPVWGLRLLSRLVAAGSASAIPALLACAFDPSLLQKFSGVPLNLVLAAVASGYLVLLAFVEQ